MLDFLFSNWKQLLIIGAVLCEVFILYCSVYGAEHLEKIKERRREKC